MATDFLGSLLVKIEGNAKSLNDAIDDSKKRVENFSKLTGKIGKTLTKNVTLPLGVLGGAAIKFASDLAESTNAVSVVFEDSADTILAWGETAAENAGLSRSAFNETATIIGAQLKQAGLSISDTADRTIDLTQRAADLASVFNTSVPDAAGALGAALRGESEPARRFGINISDAAVQAEALATGLVRSTSEITDAIKVQARYSLILKQSNDVAGDFANTNDGFANGLRVLRAEAEDLGAEFGQVLLPVAQELIQDFRGFVGVLGDLDESTIKAVVTIGALAAAAGPAIKGIQGLSVALSFLAANPAVLAVGALGAVAAAVAALSNAKNRRGIEELSESLSGLADATELSAEDMRKFGDIISREISKGGKASFKELQERVTRVSEELGISEELLIDIGLASGSVVGQYKEQLQQLRDQSTELVNVIELENTRNGNADIREARERKRAELERQRLARVQEIADAEQAAEQELESLRISRLSTEERQALVIQAQIDDLVEVRNKAREAGVEYSTIQTLINELVAERDNLLSSLDEEEEKVEAVNVQLDEQTANLLFLEDQAAEFTDSFKGGLEELEAEVLDLDELLEDLAETFTTSLLGGFELVGQAIVEQTNAWDAFKEAAKAAISATLRALGEQLAVQAVAAFIPGFSFNPVAGAGYAAGSAAAFTAAGIVGALADGGVVAPNNGNQVFQMAEAGVPEMAMPLTSSAIDPFADAVARRISSQTVNNNSNVTVNSMFALGNDAQLNETARRLFPYFEKEAQRRGTSIVR